MVQYEVTFIVDPVLSTDEINATCQTYADMLTSNGATIIHTDQMGLRQLAYPIKRRTSGVYFCLEFQLPNGTFIDKMELAFRRDERVMRFLSVRLDKYGIKYNEDKRNGLIGKVKKKEKKKDTRGRRGDQRRSSRPQDRSRSQQAPATDQKSAQ